MLEYIKGVIWPRGEAKDKQGKPIYRYTILGCIVTDKPLTEFDSKNSLPEFNGLSEIVIEGQMFGVCDSLQMLPMRPAKFRLGTADCVLTSLGDV